MIRKYKYRYVVGYEIILFGYVICAQKYSRNIPYDLIVGNTKSIYINGYYVYAVKLRKRK